MADNRGRREGRTHATAERHRCRRGPAGPARLQAAWQPDRQDLAIPAVVLSEPRLLRGYCMIRLEGRRVILRPLRLDELDAVLTARGRLGIGLQFGGAPQGARLRRRLARSGQLARGHLDLAVEVDGRLIGEIQARGRPAQTLPPAVFELGILLYDPADRGRGFGKDAVALLTGWLFEQAGAARVQAGTAVGNAAMRRVLERLGFACEGVMRGFMPEGTGRTDFALYAVTRPDWPAAGCR
jgi:RimJ/RimL family protein N-acetyltransferase